MKGDYMERLTERDEFGNADIIGVDSEDLQLNLDFKQMNKVTDTLNKLAEYEDLEDLIGIPMKDLAEILRQNIPEDCKHPHKAVVLTDDDVDRWNGYKNAEEQGLMLRLPCKVGDTIYVNGVLGVGEAEEYKVIRVDYHSNLATNRSEFYIEALLVVDPRNSIGFYDKEIGKTVFFTKAEAEQKLKELRGNQNDRE